MGCKIIDLIGLLFVKDWLRGEFVLGSGGWDSLDLVEIIIFWRRDIFRYVSSMIYVVSDRN